MRPWPRGNNAPVTARIGDIPMAKSTQAAKPVSTPKPTGKVLQDQSQAPASTEAAPKAKRTAEWRSSLKKAGIVVTENSVITFNQDAYNLKPKRNKSKIRIETYYKPNKDGSPLTVGQFRKRYVEGGEKGPLAMANADLNWDFAHGFISVK